ncbi:MAG: bifunctional folylpolyglutamate synthase/dihydrofolate synthase [Planctomycetota bacterium]|jgi:dihydrofolate synthase/folylpolyglutamate synthase
MTSTESAPFHSAVGRLFERINYERQEAAPRGELKLDNIRQLCQTLGNPEREYPIVHVAGTKGKGSVSSLAGRILQAAGLKTGVYTSPHLESFNQRYALDQQPISDGRLDRLLNGIWPHVELCDREADQAGVRRLTFFDIATAAAFLYFAEESVDAAVFEVGLGGRLDSTNVCLPDVAVITTISFDHCRQLGDTLAKIAGEKAGIIKPGVPVISGVLPDEPRTVIEEVAKRVGAPLFQLGSDFEVTRIRRVAGGQHFSTAGVVNGLAYEFADLSLPMLGEHQAYNAGLAIAAAVAFQVQREVPLMRQIPEAVSGFQHAGRIEIVQQVPTVILDVAHNVASIEALLATLRVEFPGRKKVGLFAFSRDKDQVGMLRRLLPEFERVVLTRFVENPRAVNPEQLLGMARELAEELKISPQLQTAESPLEAWSLVQADLADDELCVVAGSVFLVAELRQAFVTAPSRRGD